MLLIINPYATSMTPHIRTLVLYALQARYEVDAVDTQARGHATELSREAADEGYDVVVSLGGDGTVNEVANGLAGSQTPLTCLPGGATNVLCKMLGIPGDIVGATAHLLNLADAWRPHRIDLARVNGRHFTFSGGLGLDAAVVKSVDEQPARKTALRQWYFGYSAIRTFGADYLKHPPQLEVHAGGKVLHGVTAVVQNGEPLHVLQRPPAARRRPQPPRQRQPRRRGAPPGVAAGHADVHRAAVPRPVADRPPARHGLHRRVRRPRPQPRRPARAPRGRRRLARGRHGGRLRHHAGRPLRHRLTRMADGQPLDDHVGVALRRAYQHAVANLTARIARFDLSPLEFSVLVRLHDIGSWTQNSLGRSIFMEPANIGALVRRLAERGLVTREPDPDDRRAIRVSITPAGIELLAVARTEADAANTHTLSVLEPAERAELMALLRRLTAG